MPAFAILFVLVGLGTVGFHATFGGRWVSDLYRTLVTITALGDGRVLPQTTGQYVFVAALSVFGYATWALFVAIVAGILISIDIRSRWGGPSLSERIGALRGHTIVLGGGRVGRQVALELAAVGRDVVVVERDPDVAAPLAETGLLVLVRDALEDDTLHQAGLSRAAGVVLALPDDAQNLYALLAVRDIAPRARVVARAETTRAERHLRGLGVDRVVMPTVLGGRRLARLIARPATSDFMDAVMDEGGIEVREQRVAPGDALEGASVRDVRLHVGEHATLLAIHRAGALLPLPSADDRIRAGDTLVVACLNGPTGTEDLRA